jgi:hypothetical protein
MCSGEEVLPVQDVDEWYEHDTLTGNVLLKQASVNVINRNNRSVAGAESTTASLH